MARLEWDRIGERFFESGISHGVLYIPDETGTSIGVPWCGLTGFREKFSDETQSYFLDSVKYLDRGTPGEFEGALTAFTYPYEFESVIGVKRLGDGLFIDDQPGKQFGLSFRTNFGSGYQIHILYGLMATPSAKTFSTFSQQNQPSIFSWDLAAKPSFISQFRPTSHVIVDSTEVGTNLLTALEDVLYGSDVQTTSLPTMEELKNLVDEFVIWITDNGDGTWSATGPVSHITMLDENTFQISDVNGAFLDLNTYEISTTYLE